MTDIYAVPPGTMLDAALDYISRGWCIFPVAGQRGGDAGAKWKAPYGVGRWSIESSRDEAKIRAWYEGNDDIGIGLDMGKSGLMALDGDQHDELVEWAGIENLTKAPSWRGHPLRRSYLFQQPLDGDPIGCPVRVWGEIRGVGGYMVIPPSPHPIGGRYQWLTLADPHPLPEVLADALRATVDGQPSSSLVPDATNEQVVEFIARHTERAKPVFLDNIMIKYHSEIEAGAGRFPTLRDHLVWAMEEAATGMFTAREAVDLLGAAYKYDLANVGQPRPFDKSEWDRVLRWAIGRAMLKNPAERLERLASTDAPVPLLDMDGYEQTELPVLSATQIEYNREVEKRERQLRVDRDARQLMRAGEYVEPPKAITLAELFSTDYESIRWRVGAEMDFTTPADMDGNGGLLPMGGSVIFTGVRKSGKTSIALDLVRCLADGDAFLGRFGVTKPTGRVYVMDYESTHEQAKRWYLESKIQGSERVILKLLRGQPNPYSSEMGRAHLVAEMQSAEAEILIVDPLSVLLEDLREDENDNASTRKGLDDLRRMAQEAGVREIVVLAHAGKSEHGNARGASAIEDWPDAIWRLKVNGEGRQADRVFSAFGRDVDVQPSDVHWTHDTRRPIVKMVGDADGVSDEEEANRMLALQNDALDFFKFKRASDAHADSKDRGWATPKAMRDSMKYAMKPAVSLEVCDMLEGDGRLEKKMQGSNPMFRFKRSLEVVTDDEE